MSRIVYMHTQEGDCFLPWVFVFLERMSQDKDILFDLPEIEVDRFAGDGSQFGDGGKLLIGEGVWLDGVVKSFNGRGWVGLSAVKPTNSPEDKAAILLAGMA